MLHQHDHVNLSEKLDISISHQQDHISLSGKFDINIIPKPIRDHHIGNYIEYLKQKDERYFPKAFHEDEPQQQHQAAKKSSSDNEGSTPSPKKAKR